MKVSPKQRLHHTEIGYHYLREAYDAFKWAGAIHTAARVRACLKSAQGAVRHAERLERSGPGNRTITVHRRRPSKFWRDLHKGFAEVKRQHRKEAR